MSGWLNILKKEVDNRGAIQVAKELGISRSSVDLLIRGQYNADPSRMIKKISAIYGNNGSVACPVLGRLSPNRCAETWDRSKKIGNKAGNPETLRLYKACGVCEHRS